MARRPLCPLVGCAQADLVHEERLGTFTRRVDAGLPLRQAALAALAALFARYPALVDPDMALDALVPMLHDAPALQPSVHRLITGIAPVSVAALSRSLPGIVDSLRGTLWARAPEDAVQQEVEQLQDAVDSALALLHALGELDAAASSSAFCRLVEEVQASSLGARLLQLQRGASAASTGSADAGEPRA